MLNLAKYAAVAALVVGLDVAATKPASAWGDTGGITAATVVATVTAPFGPPSASIPTATMATGRTTSPTTRITSTGSTALGHSIGVGDNRFSHSPEL